MEAGAALKDAPTGTDEAEANAKGKLFELPKITVDEASPTAITIAFSGSITLDRSQADDAALFNKLVEGKPFELTVSGLVAGSKKTHRRDSEGNVDAIAQTKSLTIDSVDV